MLVMLATATATLPVGAVGEPRNAHGQRSVSLDDLLLGTRLCMREAISTLLVQGVRDSGEIITFALSVCGDGLTDFMRTTMQRPAAEVAVFVEGIAYKELERFPGLVRSGSLPTMPRQRENSDIYIISTFKSGQAIDVRRADVAQLRDAAFAMTNALQKNTPSREQLLNAAKATPEKDRCFNLHSSMVALASIDAGTLDALQKTRELLRNSISSIEAVNSEAKINCEMR